MSDQDEEKPKHPGGRPSDQVIAIYLLRDPGTYEPRYVGKAANPKKRLVQHLGPSSLRGRTYKARWLAALVRQGKKPLLEILQWVSTQAWSGAEKHYIAEFKAMGARLTNGDAGGLGGQTGPESRARYIKRMMSKAYTDFLRLGLPDYAERHALRLRRLYALRPNSMPKTWATIGMGQCA